MSARRYFCLSHATNLLPYDVRFPPIRLDRGELMLRGNIRELIAAYCGRSTAAAGVSGRKYSDS